MGTVACPGVLKAVPALRNTAETAVPRGNRRECMGWEPMPRGSLARASLRNGV